MWIAAGIGSCGVERLWGRILIGFCPFSLSRDSESFIACLFPWETSTGEGETPACLLSISRQMKNENAIGSSLLSILEVRSDSQGNVDWNAVPWRGYLSIGMAEPLPYRFRERAAKEREDIRRLTEKPEPLQLHVAELWGHLGDDDHADLQGSPQ